jgi:hypothetical protein
MRSVMKRFLSSVLFAGAVTAIAVACDSGGPSGSFATGGSTRPFCSEFGNCETCALQPSCGWCYRPDGTGSCSSEPGECLYSWQGTWTWGTSGCREAAQPTVGPEAEGGTSVAPVDAATIDAVAATDGAILDSASHASDGAPANDSTAGASDGATPGVDAGSVGESTPDSGASAVDAGGVGTGAPSPDADVTDGG